MVAKEILDNSIIPLLTSNTGVDALSVMSENNIKHLPIVNEKQLLGTISEDDIMENDIMEPIGSYNLKLTKAFSQDDDHIFEILQLLANNHLTAIPVVDKNLNYIGVISQQALINFFAQSYSFKDPGSIVVIKMEERDYSLGEISRVIELENVRILSTFITYADDKSSIFLTMKLNTQDLTNILTTLRRYNYDIYSSFTEADFIDNLKERYDALMSYLNV
jgi:acetoin utilization protein AcuB